MVECSDSSFNALWGPSAEDFKLQLMFHELVPDMIGAFNEKGDNGLLIRFALSDILSVLLI